MQRTVAQITTKMSIRRSFILPLGLLMLSGCVSSPVSSESSLPADPSVSSAPAAVADSDITNSDSSPSLTMEDSSKHSIYADVTGVSTSGDAGAYRFSVTIQSPDTGCDQYSDWWEVISPEGELIHRRVLLHSHVNEQPFSRSSGPIDVEPDQMVIVRAHMHPSGYGGQAMEGTVADGFVIKELPKDFATDLANQPPLPTGCNF